MGKYLSRTFLLLILSFAFTFLHAQTAEVRGFLYEEATGEPLIFSNVYLKGTTIGASSNVNGYYSITKLKPGSYTLMVTSIGFDTIELPITLKAGQILSKNFELSEAATMLKAVEVKGDKIDRQNNVNVGITKITPREIKILPSIGGEPDLAQYIQTLPGVVFTGDQGGQLYIRGGAPVQNLVLLDGMMVYNPFHSIGLFSVFDTEIMRSVDIFTGGFKADYGGRNSAVIDIKTRDGNKKKFAGHIGVNPFTSKVQVEGPIFKQKDSKSGSSSFLFSTRRSYLNKTSPILYSYANEQGELPYSFNDTYGKMTFQGGSGSKTSFFGFHFGDKARLDSLNDMNWTNWGVGSNFLLLPSSSSTVITGTLGYSEYIINISEQSAKPRFSEVNNFNLGLDFNYFPGKDEVRYGLNVMGNNTNYTGFKPTGSEEEFIKNNTEISGFFRYKIVKTRFVLEPSFRLHYYASLSKMSPEPRLGLKYNITEKLRFKLAGGWFSQNLIATRSDRDVVNLFAGYLSSPDILLDADGERVANRLSTARHLILGFEYDFFEKFEFDLEPYVKDFTQLIGINRDYRIDNDFLVERGLAQGVDLLLKYDDNDLFFQVGYSLASVKRTGLIDASGVEKKYPTNYDRRHNINALIAYDFGKKDSWELSIRWNYGSGFPFTPTQAFYEDYSFAGNLGLDLTTANGDLGILYGELNSKRLPQYHRLDLSLKKTIDFKNHTKLEINAGAINVYNRANIFYLDRVTSLRVNQLPFLPSVGLVWKF